MTIQESQSLIGRAARYEVRSMGFDVTIIGVRQGFGRTDLQIRPAQGTGETWVSSQSVKLLLSKPLQTTPKNTNEEKQ